MSDSDSNGARRVDLPLEILLRTAHDIAPELPEDLIVKCYEIQRVCQFDREDALRFELTEALIEKALADPTGGANA
jgi:hypothetical protein